MELTPTQLDIIRRLDDGSLYACPDIVQEQFRYPHMHEPRLLLGHDRSGQIRGYLPTGKFYSMATSTYIAAMPNSPPVSATYPPGAEYVLETLEEPHYDTDMVSAIRCCRQYPTASCTIGPLPPYLDRLSVSRRRDVRRKLHQAQRFELTQGSLADVALAWPWMQAIWDRREGRFGPVSYLQYLVMNLSWLMAVQRSGRARFKLDKYLLDGQMVGINCCIIHPYQGRLHCDDYLTWYDPERASGLGIISAVRNLTHPQLQGARYNLGNPGVGHTHQGHEYKLNLIPESLRLTQAVFHIPEPPRTD
ncbi:MAG: hypothetical protein KDI15_07700 [Thiothrix sp.]|mgnify:CR=1 FL=1|nr:hypothetical protein [Thiothrix sp.]HPE61192.1 hypothetical protein [Thiolinea sp.]